MTTMRIARRQLLVNALAAAAALTVLAGVFALYTHPTLLVAMADMVWACFN